MRHGFSLGELARYYNVTQGLDCDLTVIPAAGWRRGDYFDATGLPWVLPSPNLPTLDAAIVYPGQVLLEGTNLSEGRGTTRPFELFGAPFLEPGRILDRLQGIELPGVVLRTACFEPTFHKWAGELCRGFQLHVTDRRTFKPYYTTLALLAVIRELYPRAVRLAPAPLRIRDGAPALRPSHRRRPDPQRPGERPDRGGTGECLARRPGPVYGIAPGVSAVSGVREIWSFCLPGETVRSNP